MATRPLSYLRQVTTSVRAPSVGGRRALGTLANVRREEPSTSNIVISPVPELSFNTGNFSQFLFRDAHKWTNKTAMACCDSDEEITYGRLIDHIGRWGAYLLKTALAPGAVVAVVSPNSMLYPVVLYGTMRVGRVYTGINPQYTPDEIAHHLNDSGAQMVVSFGPLVPAVKKAMAINKNNLPMLTIGPSVDGISRVEDILDDTSLGFAEPVQVSGKETMCLLYSSGTTGRPKGAAVSHNAGIANITMAHHPRFFAPLIGGIEDKSYLQMLPLFHISGLIGITGVGLAAGMKMINLSKFDPSTFMGHMLKHKVTNMHMVPSLLNFVLTRPELCKENFGHLKSIIVGAAPVPPSAITAIEEKLGDGVILQHVYGMTEVLITHMDPVDDRRSGYTGQLFPTNKAKVIDLETGEHLPANHDGEICIKCDTTMNEYLNNEEATRATIDEDGWVHTGDIGHYDEQGYFRVVDRTKDLIKVNGLQVSPSELEDVLLQLPGVVEASVVGVPHPKLGEAPRAYLVLDGSSLTTEKIHEWMGHKLSKYKQLVAGIAFLDQLPKNATGKILRRELARTALEEIS